MSLALEGHVTSCYWSGELGMAVGLAMVKGGRARHGETLFALLAVGPAAAGGGASGAATATDATSNLPRGAHGDRFVAVRLTDPVHYDRAGARRDG
jgi:hypothetical protein